MRIITKAIIDIETGALIVLEAFDYTGPVALCDRGQSTAAFNQAEGAASTDQGAATSADTATNNALSTYSNNLSNFMNFGQNTYGANGTYAADQKAINTAGAAASAQTLGSQMGLNAMRTGENTASYAPAVAAETQAGQQAVTANLAQSDANRLQALTNINQYGVQASALPAQVQAGLYGSSLSGASGQQGSATQAASVPSGWQVFGQDLAGAVGSAAQGYATGMCPCEGSKLLLDDGIEVLVEVAEKGDKLKAFGKQPPNTLTAKPEGRRQECYEIALDRGWFHRGSATHTIALEGGGYAYMPELKGKSVLTIHGPRTVISVEAIGEKWVRPISVDGSHSYIADGVYCLA